MTEPTGRPPNAPASLPVRGEDLREIGLFGGLPDEVLDHMAATLTLGAPNSGEFVFREGDDAREMYVVLDGEMEVLKHSRHGREARVALLGPGDWFGEMSILDVRPRSASVRAVAPSRVLKLTAADLDALYRRDLKSYSLIVLNVARELSRRLRVADGILADFMSIVVDEYVTIRRSRR
jgi:CRP/FNR family cyclic AMP-dependent transcriptional regulator